MSRTRDRYERKLQKRIEEVYSEAQKDIERKLEDFKEKYKVKYEKHLQELNDGKITKEQFDSWVRGQIFQSKQWEAKREQIQKVLYNANTIAVGMINDSKINLFILNANYQAYLLEHKVGVNFGFGLYDVATVKRLLRSDPQILPMRKIDQPKDYVWNKRKVNNAITQGIIQGEKLADIAKRLEEGLCTTNKNKMLTFARTGMTEAQNAGRLTRLREAEKMGIKVHKEWMATFDNRTRYNHRLLDGQKRPMNKPFEIEGYEIMYPGDPTAHPSMTYNCRCTMVGDLDDFPSEYERYDNIEGKPVKEMTYTEWENAKKGIVVPQFNQVSIGRAKTIQEINNLLNIAGLFRVAGADLTGCDLESAKSIAAAYEQVFENYPQLKGKFDPPDAHPRGMGDSTYAWCYARQRGRVQVNPKMYGNWNTVVRSYESDVLSNWHPKGTTAESIVVHEIGHAIDGLLAKEGIIGGYTKSGEFRWASSTLKTKVMNRAAKLDPNVQQYFDIWGSREGMGYAVSDLVSRYATVNNREWFAECFAEYITSANPRLVASEFGKELEKLVAKLQ